VGTNYGYYSTSDTLQVTAVRATTASVAFHCPERPSLALTQSFGASPDVAFTTEGLVRKSSYVAVVTVRSPSGVASRTVDFRVR
jgi:hypothetical protein